MHSVLIIHGNNGENSNYNKNTQLKLELSLKSLIVWRSLVKSLRVGLIFMGNLTLMLVALM